MAKPILVANWKNHPGSLLEVKGLLKGLSKDSRFYKRISFLIAPPLPYMEAVSLYNKSFTNLASQDISIITGGTHTGIVTPEILKSFGVRMSIIGHSESRALGETDELVSQKVKIAIKEGIISLVCVGEKLRDADGEHFEFLREQLKRSLAGLGSKTDFSKLAIAYEPIWAIGKGASGAIDPLDLSQSVIFIRKVLTDMFGRAIAERVPILYGGSVEPNNVDKLMMSKGIRGFLVGHASLNAKNLGVIAKSLVSK